MAVQPVDAFAVAAAKVTPSSPPSKKSGGATAAALSKSPELAIALEKSGKPRSSTTAAVNSRKGNPEKRANHNAIERARRESLNNRFLILAASLPAISQIRRPSKSLIVNRSLQFVADSLSREVRYRDMLKEQHARGAALAREVNELRARCGVAAERGLEPEPTLELPKALTEVEKASASRRPRSASGSAADAKDGAGSGDALSDMNAGEFDDDDFDDYGSLPLPAGGLDAFSLSLPTSSSLAGQYSPLSAASEFDATVALAAASSGYFVNPQQHQHQQLAAAAAAAAAASSGLVAPAHVSLAATPKSNSPPELSSSMSAASVDSTASPHSSAGHASPANHHAAGAGLFDIAQPYPVMTTAAVAAAAAAGIHPQYGFAPTHPHPHQQQQHGFDPHAHVRAATFPAAMQHQQQPQQAHLSLLAGQQPQQLQQQQQQQQHGLAPAQPFDVGAYMAALQAHTRQHAAAAAAAEQQHGPQQHQQQQQQQQLAAAAYAAQQRQQPQQPQQQWAPQQQQQQTIASPTWAQNTAGFMAAA